LLQQTRSDWEAIVVDDASTIGDVRQVINMFNDPRIKLVCHERNKGLAAARNTGFRLARAELVLPLDADDKLLPQCLQYMVQGLEKNPDADCIFGDLQLFGDSINVWHYRVQDARAMTMSQWIPGPSTVMRRSLWERIGGYCEAEELRAGNEDWDFWLGAVSREFHPVHISAALYLYRVQGDSMATRLRYQYSNTCEFMYLRHKLLFEQHGTSGVFLSNGYRVSAIAAWARGEYMRALRMARTAITKSPNPLSTMNYLSRHCFPALTNNRARVVKSIRDKWCQMRKS